MGQSHDASELECLLSLAGRLRQLAAAALFQHERTLYLLAAEALEKHCQCLACNSQDAATPVGELELYRPVNFTV